MSSLILSNHLDQSILSWVVSEGSFWNAALITSSDMPFLSKMWLKFYLQLLLHDHFKCGRALLYNGSTKHFHLYSMEYLFAFSQSWPTFWTEKGHNKETIDL